MISYLVDGVLFCALTYTAIRVGMMYRELRSLRKHRSEYIAAINDTGRALDDVHKAVNAINQRGAEVLYVLEQRIEQGCGVVQELDFQLQLSRSQTAREATRASAPVSAPASHQYDHMRNDYQQPHNHQQMHEPHMPTHSTYMNSGADHGQQYERNPNYHNPNDRPRLTTTTRRMTAPPPKPAVQSTYQSPAYEQVARAGISPVAAAPAQQYSQAKPAVAVGGGFHGSAALAHLEPAQPVSKARAQGEPSKTTKGQPPFVAGQKYSAPDAANQVVEGAIADQRRTLADYFNGLRSEVEKEKKSSGLSSAYQKY